ncbi:MAG: hypothetical protein DRR19_28710 [Candidatus Parabeggiatoa sp. nov. 1]|nr:MAG: hypothetical protein DRR19_28710 [Gammaproteobacteria bacterium]
MVKKVQPRNTKAEILEAYKELESAYKELDAKQKSLATPPATTGATKTAAAPPSNPSKVSKKEMEMTQTKEAQFLPKDGNAQASMKEVIDALGQLGEKFNTALSQLSTHLLVEAASLKDVRTNVEAESSRLATLYSLTIEEDTLSNLLKQYGDEASQYQDTLKQKREDSEKTWLEKNQAWQTEKEETDQHWQEQEKLDSTAKNREDTEYHYDLTLKRGMSDEEYAQQLKEEQQALQALDESHRKLWEEREKGLAERETQFEEFKSKVERFPKELEMAIKKAKEEGTNIARYQAKIKADLLGKEFAGDEEVSQLKIRALEEQVANQVSQIDKFSKQLEAALKQAQELAVKAIEGTSSHGSFQALKEIALEQAKSQPKAK